MNTCVACAERDKSCPYGWRMAIDCVYLGGRNMMNHAPTAHTLPYSTYPFFANFTYTTCNIQRKHLYSAVDALHKQVFTNSNPEPCCQCSDDSGLLLRPSPRPNVARHGERNNRKGYGRNIF